MDRTLPLKGKYCQDEGEKQDKRFPLNINTQVKSERLGKIYHTNPNPQKTGMAIMIIYIERIPKNGSITRYRGRAVVITGQVLKQTK